MHLLLLFLMTYIEVVSKMQATSKVTAAVWRTRGHTVLPVTHDGHRFIMVDDGIDASTAALAARLHLDTPGSIPQRAYGVPLHEQTLNSVPLHLQPQRHGYMPCSSSMGVQHVVQALPQAGFAPGFAHQTMVLPPGAGDPWGGVRGYPRAEPSGYPGYPGAEEELTSQGVFKRAWTAEEDANLLQLVKDHGAQSWSVIADKLHGRVGKQCRERYSPPPLPPPPPPPPNGRDSPGP